MTDREATRDAGGTPRPGEGGADGTGDAGRAVREAGREAGRQVAPWVERLARAGYLVKGGVYVLVGLLAVQAAFGIGGETTGASGALRALARQPFGSSLLAVVAVGLFGYAGWRLIQGLLDVERKGADPKGLLKRFGYAVSGIAYGGLALQALQLFLGRGSSRDNSSELWTARALDAPFGGWLVFAGALVMFGLALNAGVVAVGRMYRDKLKLSQMNEGEKRFADVTAIAGLLGRGAVFAIIGVLLVRAALFHDPHEAGSSEQALEFIARGPFGAWLLALVALGLVAYGAYAGVQSRFRRINVEPPG